VGTTEPVVIVPRDLARISFTDILKLAWVGAGRGPNEARIVAKEATNGVEQDVTAANLGDPTSFPPRESDPSRPSDTSPCSSASSSPLNTWATTASRSTLCALEVDAGLNLIERHDLQMTKVATQTSTGRAEPSRRGCLTRYVTSAPIPTSSHKAQRPNRIGP